MEQHANTASGDGVGAAGKVDGAGNNTLGVDRKGRAHRGPGANGEEETATD
jgi:hypothetical protein